MLDADEIVTNSYSRKEFKLNPVQVALYDYIRGIEIVLSHPVYRKGLSNTDINSANNVQFDMSRFGIEFVASPRHADGLVITGPITSNMAEPLQICYNATPDPKMVVLCGTDAISGGIFEGSPALDRRFLDSHKVDLYIAGNPAHPLTVINGLLSLTGRDI